MYDNERYLRNTSINRSLGVRLDLEGRLGLFLWRLESVRGTAPLQQSYEHVEEEGEFTSAECLHKALVGP